MFDKIRRNIEFRLQLSFFGGLAGLCLYLLFEIGGSGFHESRLILFLLVLTGSFFSVFLATAGPVGVSRAFGIAGVVGVGASVLFVWASTRFDNIGAYLDTGAPVVLFAVLVALPVPFLLALVREGQAWRDYAALFDNAWNIVVRYMVAWGFTGLFWGVVLLSDALLRIVGLDIIRDLLRMDVVPPVLTGLALGLAIAVVNELEEYISPYLLLRVLRLLLPVVVVVVAVFIAALPFRGLSGLFGGLSPALILLVMAAAGATLITTSLAQNNEQAASGATMRVSAQVMAVLVAVLAGLAAYGIGVRIVQYGLTPNRIMAALVALVGLGYGGIYTLAVLRRTGGSTRWGARIRSANVVMALATVALTALWFTPLLNPERISTASQIARFEAGKTTVEDLDLWAIGREWGVAGQAGLVRLRDMDTPGLHDRIVRLDTSPQKRIFENGPPRDRKSDLVEALIEVMPRRPDGGLEEAARWVLRASDDYRLQRFREACAKQSPAGNPQCVMLFPDGAGGDAARPDALVLSSNFKGRLDVLAFRHDGSTYIKHGVINLAQGAELATLGEAAIDAVLAGEYAQEPVRVQGLRLKDRVLFIRP
jgi:hypothetical protein